MYKQKIYRAKTGLKQQSEESLHKSVCDYLKAQYPKILFNSDMSGIKLTIGQSIKAAKLRSNKGFPDIAIYEPRGKFHGFFVELKREGEVLYKLNEDPKTDHIQDQLNCQRLLMAKGYYSTIAIGWEDAKIKINNYLNLK